MSEEKSKEEAGSSAAPFSSEQLLAVVDQYLSESSFIPEDMKLILRKEMQTQPIRNEREAGIYVCGWLSALKKVAESSEDGRAFISG